MKGKTLKRSSKTRHNRKMKAAFRRQLPLQRRQASGLPFHNHQSAGASSSELQSMLEFESLELQNMLEFESSELQKMLEFESSELRLHASASEFDINAGADEKDCILSQDLFCTPDYMTPDDPNLFNCWDPDKENTPCPKSPVKLNTVKSKRCRQESFLVSPLSPSLCEKQIVELENDSLDPDDLEMTKTAVRGTEKGRNYVSQSAVALRCQVMPPPCIKNPYLKDASEMAEDPLGYQRSKCAGFFPSVIGGNGLSRYHTDFHEIEKIGAGNFSRVFKVLKRIDGCLYAVKHNTRLLHLDSERRKALMEVQALAALGFHENIVAYYSSWFENELLYIQFELCDHSLSNKFSQYFDESKLLVIMYQMAKALQFIHDKGIAHLDVKPDNIYVKDGIYKLGDFGCATLLDKSLQIDDGDSRYLSPEMLNENYDHLSKVDIFSLGASMYELIRGSPLANCRNQPLNLKEGKIPLLPGRSLQLQHLLKVMMDPDPVRRPSAKELLENSIFDKIRRNKSA